MKLEVTLTLIHLNLCQVAPGFCFSLTALLSFVGGHSSRKESLRLYIWALLPYGSAN